MNYCIHLKKRKNKPYCNIIRKEITFSCCRECDNKEYKKSTNSYKKSAVSLQNHAILHKNSALSNNNQIRNSAASLQSSAKTLQKMKNKSKKLAKLERNRFSVFTDNKDKCMFCPAITNLTWHEIYAGRNRKNSMEDGFCLRMCLLCHETKQEDTQFNEFWHREGQLYYEKNIGSRKQFLARYRRNYLE